MALSTTAYQVEFANNALKSRVAEYIIEQADGYGLGDAIGRPAMDACLRDCLMDATRGTDSGWWGWMIYTSEMVRDLPGYAGDVGVALGEYEDAIGEAYCYNPHSASAYPEGPIPASRILAALLALKGGDADAYEGLSESLQEAAMLGYRFAVEWYAGELASEWGIEL